MVFKRKFSYILCHILIMTIMFISCRITEYTLIGLPMPVITTFNSWALSFDYSQGFYPRCLMGQIFSIAQHYGITGDIFAWSMWGIFGVSFIVMIATFIKNTSLEKLPKLNNILILLNIIVSGMAFSRTQFGRPDILLYSVLFLSIISVFYRRYFFVIILSMLGIMLHEGYIFFLWCIPGYFMLSEIILGRKKGVVKWFVCYAVCGILLGIWFYKACYLFSDGSVAVDYFKSKIQVDASDSATLLAYLRQEFSGANEIDRWRDAFMPFIPLVTLGVINIILSIPVLASVMEVWIKKIKCLDKKVKIMAILGLSEMLSMLPCFLCHADYGRWMVFVFIQQLISLVIFSLYVDIPGMKVQKNWYPIQFVISLCGTPFALSLFQQAIVQNLFGI